MTNYNKNYLLILTIIYIFFVMPTFLPHALYKGKKDQTNSNTNTKQSQKIYQEPKHSGFWNLIDPIYIDDQNPSFDWSTSVTNFDWIAGEGTKAKPYRIENVTINGKSGSCIRILNSHKNFIIQNVSLFNSSFRGISLEGTTNGTIKNCEIYNCSRGIDINGDRNLVLNNTIFNCTGGIEISNSLNGTIQNCKIYDCSIGVWFNGNCDDSLFSNNTVFDSGRGIEIENCLNMTIVENNLINITGIGIWLKSLATNITILNNTIHQAERGIEVSECENITISHNKITNMSWTGIYFNQYSNSSLVSNNSINNCSRGIEIDESLNMKILYNNLTKLTGLSIRFDYGSNKSVISHNIINQAGSGIEIEESINTTIKFNNLSDISGDAIWFDYHADNGLISNNTISNNQNGITIYDSMNVNIKFNTLSDISGDAIWFDHHADNGLVSNNTISNNQNGITIYDSMNVNITHNELISIEEMGILLDRDSHHSEISNNKIFESGNGIKVYDCLNTRINHNNLTDIQNVGLTVERSDNNSIKYNNILALSTGILLNSAANNTFRHNSLCGGGFHLFFMFMNDRLSTIIDTSNTIDDKPVYFYKNQIGLDSDDFLNPGQIILTNCSKVLIKNFNLSARTVGIDIFNCTQIIIRNNTLSQNLYAINAWICNDSSIINNQITHSDYEQSIGIYLIWSRNFTIEGNTIANYTWGMGFSIYSNKSIITRNLIQNCSQYGLLIYQSSGENIIYENAFLNNKIHAYDNGSANLWDNGPIGNYWDNFTGNDADGNGIGDSWYCLAGHAGSIDHYPMIYPFYEDTPIVDDEDIDNEENDQENGNGDSISSIHGFPLQILFGILLLGIAAYSVRIQKIS